MVKNMNSKMTTNSQLSTTEPKKQTKQTTRTGKELQNYRNGDQMEDIQQGGGGGRMGENIQGIRSINGRHKIDRRLRIV